MLLAGPVQPAVANRPPPPRPGLSWAEADVLAQALEEVEAAFKAGKPVTKLSLVVTEAQLRHRLACLERRFHLLERLGEHVGLGPGEAGAGGRGAVGHGRLHGSGE